MANTPRQVHQTTDNNQEIGSLQADHNNISTSGTQAPTTSNKLKKASKLAQPANISTTKKSGSVSEEGKDHSSALTPHSRYQPSKQFIIKCRAELDTLLESIKDSYHEDIKSLYNDEIHADLIVNIGKDFKKPLHKCILASRAFKFYTALRPFCRQEYPVEKDIIISEFQSVEEDKPIYLKGSQEEKEAEKESTEELPVINCDLPDDLIHPDLLLNFVRRAYLNTDLSEEDFKLNQRLVSWLKINKPETIRSPSRTNCSPDHRESFRTIVPDYEDIILSPTSVMSHRENKNSPCADDNEEASSNNSLKDESYTGSLLTRTETFELIRGNPDGSRVCSPSKASTLDNEDGGNESESEDVQAPYAPTTRTGLKPKQFTTPKDLPTNSKVKARTKETTPSPPKSKTRDESVKAKTTTGVASSSTRNATISPKQPQSQTIAAKRLSQGSTASETASESHQVKANPSSTGSKASPTAASSTPSSKSKAALVARAHPISMERSQSPGTNLLRRSGRNFVAANKRLVSKTVDKKAAQTQGDSVVVYDSENEASSDTGSFLFGPVNSDNLAAQLDKLTLVSHSNLADCLARMFIDGPLTDATILIRNGKQINAHKCILAARSAYLADLLLKHGAAAAQDSAESTRKRFEIDLSEFSYPAVYFSMLHIYSGIVKVPEDLDLSELAELSHLLHVSTLRQVCIHNLRMDYCHFFHKPCNVCCLGVLKALPLAWRYDYTELYSKCLQWIGSHFASIFCLKEFADLKPNDLLEECYKATLSQLTQENIIPKTIECQKLLRSLPRVKWTESVICLVGRLLEDFCHYVADNYEKILQSESFHNLSKNCWECEILEENLLAAMNHLKPDSGCKTLIQLHKIECSNESFSEDPRNVSDSFANLVTKMRKYCERYLLKEAAAVVHCSSWRHMNPSLQKRIKDQAIISTDFDEPIKQLANKPKLPSSSSSSSRTTRQQLSSSPGNNGTSSDGGCSKSPSNRSTPDSRLKSPSTYLPPPKNKTAAARHVKVLK